MTIKAINLNIFNWAKGTPKWSIPVRSSLRKLRGWASTQPRKHSIEISSSNLARFGHEPTCCYQESQPSCVRVELWFSLTFTCLELTWMLDPWYFVFYFSRLPLTLCRTSLPVPSSNWHHVLRVLSVIWHPSWRPAPPTPRCRRALWQMWFMLSPLLVWGESFLQVALVSRSAPAGGRAASLTLTQHLRINDEAAVRVTPMLGPHLQPGIGF